MQHGNPGSQTKNYTLTLNLQYLNAELKRQKLSIAELARRAKVSRNELGKHINGQTFASWKTIAKIAAVLDCHPEQISSWGIQ